MIEVRQQVNAVRRQVGARTLEAGEAQTVTISQTYDAGIDDVWDACTNPERIPRWFLPLSGDLRLGGRYQLEGNAGGTVERCDPPMSFAATWEYGGQTTWIEVRLTAAPGGGTRFELEHLAYPDEHWAEFGPGAVGIGWDLALLLGLGVHLASGQVVDPEGSAAWVASDDGKQFVRLCSQAWCEAHIAAGADAADAEARAARTAAAYTATPDASSPS
ncbi:MAG: SRPBCC family protein [Actinomycetes bacterium]